MVDMRNSISAGKGKYKVWLRKMKIGQDIVLFLGGGERAHMGSIVLCEPGKKPKILNRLTAQGRTHKDYLVALPIAKKAAKKWKRPVLCVAGIHVENASKKEIKMLVRNCKIIERRL